MTNLTEDETNKAEDTLLKIRLILGAAEQALMDGNLSQDEFLEALKNIQRITSTVCSQSNDQVTKNKNKQSKAIAKTKAANIKKSADDKARADKRKAENIRKDTEFKEQARLNREAKTARHKALEERQLANAALKHDDDFDDDFDDINGNGGTGRPESVYAPAEKKPTVMQKMRRAIRD